MATYLCKKHGVTGVKMVCSHVAKGIDDGILLKMNLIETSDFFVPKIQLCNDCIIIWHGLKNEVEKEKFIKVLVPVCGKCAEGK